MADVRVQVGDTDLTLGSEGQPVSVKGSKRGEMYVVDFYTRMALAGRAYNVRAGTISVPVVGDVLITDTAAEMVTSAASGMTVIPVSTNISFNLAAATLFEAAGKSVGAAHTAGTAFVALPLKMGGTAAVTTSAVAAAGAVTVAAEAATTTRRHWSWGHPIAAGAWNTWYDWIPNVAPILVGPSAYYVQIGGDTTGPSYFASYDFIELSSTNV
jgi:hypothetical protein